MLTSLPCLLPCPGAQLAISKSWGDILGVLESLLSTVKQANVPKALVQVRRSQDTREACSGVANVLRE
jgi:hypothetical protein